MYKSIAVLMFLILAGCVTNNQAQLLPADTEYLTTTGGGFLLKSGKPMYAMSYLVKKPLPDGSLLRVTFENPENPNEPFVKNVKANEGEVMVRSEPMNSIKNRKNYRVLVEVVLSTEVISSHVQFVRFEMPDALLKQIGVQTL